MQEKIIDAYGNYQDLVEFDIHGMTLYEVKNEIPHLICQYVKNGYDCFRIIHGFNNGNVLKIYTLNTLKSDIEKQINRFKIKVIKENKGATFIIFK